MPAAIDPNANSQVVWGESLVSLFMVTAAKSSGRASANPRRRGDGTATLGSAAADGSTMRPR